MDDETLKVLEIICAKLPTSRKDSDLDWIDMDISETDFKRQGLSMDRGVAILKHKVGHLYPVVEIGEIYTPDEESMLNSRSWGVPSVSMMVYPSISDSLFRIEMVEDVPFSFENCGLTIAGKKISFGNEDSKENGCYVLEHIFSHNLKETSFYSDIHSETVKEHSNRYSGKRYYDACGVIQKRIAKETGIGDFLKFNSSERGFVSINPKYLR